MKLMKLSDLELKFRKAVIKGHFRKSTVTAVCLSRCGNYGIVGYHSGKIEKYNMQSGLHRGFYSHILTIKSNLNNIT